MPNPRGRPRTPLLERLRAIYWSHQVLAASGLDTADRIETSFSKANGPIRIARGSWSRYMRGEITPQGAAEGGNARSLVSRLGKRYPGTAEIFYHPIWQLLKLDEWYNPAQLREMYLQLPAQAWHQFVISKRTGDGRRLALELHFWRLPYSMSERIERLKSLRGIDGAAASLIEARMDLLAQTEDGFLSCLELALTQIQLVSDEDAIRSRRLKSCLLMLKAFCIAFAIRYSVAGEGDVKSRKEIEERVEKLRRSWRERAAEHTETLSDDRRQEFRAWEKDVVAVARLRP